MRFRQNSKGTEPPEDVAAAGRLKAITDRFKTDGRPSSELVSTLPGQPVERRFWTPDQLAQTTGE
jgi:hypothetical protein